MYPNPHRFRPSLDALEPRLPLDGDGLIWVEPDNPIRIGPDDVDRVLGPDPNDDSNDPYPTGTDADGFPRKLYVSPVLPTDPYD